MLDLAPPPNDLTAWLLRRDATQFVGIDVGVQTVNVASIGKPLRHQRRRNTADAELKWITRTEFGLPIDPFAPPDPDLVSRVCDCLAARLPRCVDSERLIAAIALPLPWVMYETTTDARLDECQATCDATFAGSIFQSSAHLSHWPINAAGDLHVVAATAEDAACRVAAVACDLGYQVQNILPHGVALFQAAAQLTRLVPHAVALLEPYGGMVATGGVSDVGLCRPLPGCDRSGSTARHASELEPWLELIAAEITATSRYAARHRGDRPVDAQGPVLICGSLAQADGLDAALATLLDRPVATWRYAGAERPNGFGRHPADAVEQDPRRAVALSLAHCAAAYFQHGGRPW